jgi:restriction system protein
MVFRDFQSRSRALGEAPGPAVQRTAASVVRASPPTVVASPQERIQAARQELVSALVADLLQRVRQLDSQAFEQLIVDLLVKIGYGGSRADAAARLGRSGDGGVDGVIREDPLGLDAVYIQAKCWGADSPVGPDKIGEFFAALSRKGAGKGVFVTTSDFTRGAHEAHRELGTQKRIVLINGEQLAQLMIEHEVGVRTVDTVRIQALDLEAYEGDEDA